MRDPWRLFEDHDALLAAAAAGIFAQGSVPGLPWHAWAVGLGYATGIALAALFAAEARAAELSALPARDSVLNDDQPRRAA